MPLLAAYLFLLSVLLAALPDRLLESTAVGLLTVSAGATALLIAAGVSIKYGQVAALAAAALAGCFGASFYTANRAVAIRGLIPVFVVLVGGLAFVGVIEPTPPLPIILVAPAAPLMLWLFAAGPLAHLKGLPAIAAQSAAVLLPLGIAIAWVALTGEKDGWSG